MHIQNPVILKILAYLEQKIQSEPCQSIFWHTRKLCNAYWEKFHLQNFAIFRILEYLGPEPHSESCLYRHNQAYSGIFNNNPYNNINFLFFHFHLTYFSTKFEKTVFFFTTMMSILMLDWVYLNNMRSLKTAL